MGRSGVSSLRDLLLIAIATAQADSVQAVKFQLWKYYKDQKN